MSLLIDPNTGTFVQSHALQQAAEAGEIPKVTAVMSRIVADSFVSHSMRNPTQREVLRRYTVLRDWFQILRGDKKWSMDRVLSSLRSVLTAALDGREYVPEDSVMYRVDEGIDGVAKEIRDEAVMRGPDDLN